MRFAGSACSAPSDDVVVVTITVAEDAIPDDYTVISELTQSLETLDGLEYGFSDVGNNYTVTESAGNETPLRTELPGCTLVTVPVGL